MVLTASPVIVVRRVVQHSIIFFSFKKVYFKNAEASESIATKAGKSQN